MNPFLSDQRWGVDWVRVIANLQTFYTNDWPRVQRMNSDKLAIGNLIQNKTPTDSAILVFGEDWSSAFAYHSQRRAFTQPNWPVFGRSAAAVSVTLKQHTVDLPWVPW